jgi:hypothetical protein
MMRIVPFTFFAVLSILVCVGSANASTVFSNLGPGDSYNCCLGWTVAGPNAPNATDKASPFTPSSTYTFDSVEVAFQWEAFTNAGVIWLMSDDGGLPGTILESFHFTNLPLFKTTSTQLAVGTSTLHPLLSAGVQYWVAASGEGDSLLSFNMNVTGDTGLASRDDHEPWGFAGIPGIGIGPVTTPLAGAFRVSGTAFTTAPEPSAILLLGMGVFALALTTWLRQRE